MRQLVTLFTAILLPLLAQASEITTSHGYAMYGELKYDKDFQHFDYVNPNAPKGGKIKFAHVGTFDSLNSFILKGTPAPGLSGTMVVGAEGFTTLGYETLMISSADEPYSQYGLIAESIEYPKDKSWVAFNLHHEAKWHDGKAITADDVIFSYNTILNKADPNYRILFTDVLKVEKINNHKVKFHLKNNQNASLIPIIGEELPIMPKHFWQDKDFETYSHKPLLSSGPYKVKDFILGKYIVFERVKNYWGSKLPSYIGHANFDLVHYDCYKDTNIAVEALKAGAYDFRDENSSRLWATAYLKDSLYDAGFVKRTIKHKIPANLQATFLNMRRPDFKDANFRKALTYAYDFEWMNANLFYGIYTRTKSYFDNSDFAASGIPQGKELALLEKYRDQLPPELFTQEFKMPVGGNGNSRKNLRQAKQLLLDSGYKVEKGKLISPYTGKPVVIEIIYAAPAFERIYSTYRAYLAKIGIELKLRLVDYAQYIERLDNFEFDVTTGAFTPATAPGIGLLRIWHSTSDVPGGFNLSGVHDPVVDALLEKITQASELEELQTAAHALDRVLLWNYYAIPQMYSDNYRIIYWDKFAYPEINPGYSMGVNTWWAK